MKINLDLKKGKEVVSGALQKSSYTTGQLLTIDGGWTTI